MLAAQIVQIAASLMVESSPGRLAHRGSIQSARAAHPDAAARAGRTAKRTAFKFIALRLR
jgi:hypothetical protein